MATGVLRRFSTATLVEAAGGVGALPSEIKPLGKAKIWGQAFPVASAGGDNLWIHRAVSIAPRGAVLVISTGGCPNAGYWGEVLTHAALARGISGSVIDGCVRDSVALGVLGLPIYCQGLCIRGTSKREDAVGSVGVPVTIGDTCVAVNDLIVGDEDGVVAIPARRIGEVLEAAQRREAHEASVIERLHSGATTLELFGLGPMNPEEWVSG